MSGRRLLARRLVAVAVAVHVLCATRTSSGGDADPFEALEAARARRATAGRVVEGGEERRMTRVGRPTGGTAAVGDDGAFEVEGLPSGSLLRVEVVPNSGGVAVVGASGVLASAPLEVPSVGPPTARAVFPRGAPAPLYSIELRDVAGATKISLAGEGATAAVSALGHGVDGSTVDDVLGARDVASRLQSSDGGIVESLGDGRLLARGAGLAYARLELDGDWTQVLVESSSSVDGDGDGMADGLEIANGLDTTRDDSEEDLDRDGLSNADELRRGTRADLADTDGDGLADGDEALVLGTDPLRRDTDGDGIEDGVEVAGGSDALDPNRRPGDSFSPRLRATRPLDLGTGRALVVTERNDLVVITEEGQVLLYDIDLQFFSIRLRDTIATGLDLRAIAARGASLRIAAGGAGVLSLAIVDGDLVSRGLFATTSPANDLALGDSVTLVATDAGIESLADGGEAPTQRLGALALGRATRVARAGALAWVGLPDARRLELCEVSDPRSPRSLVGSTLAPSSGAFSAIVATSTTAWVAHGEAGLLAVASAGSGALAVIDDTTVELPGRSVTTATLLGDRLVAGTTTDSSLARVFDVADDGAFAPQAPAPTGVGVAVDLALRQDVLVALSADALSVTRFLPRADRGSSPPSGSLDVVPGPLVAAGEDFRVGARVVDDVWVERVRFVVDGTLRIEDSVAPYRLEVATGDRSPPYDVEVRAFGVDLAGNVGLLGAMAVRVDRDLDGDGIVDSEDDDRDGDGIRDIEEEHLGVDGVISDPTSRDTDGDGIEDGEESQPGLDGFVTDPSSVDTDGDGLTDPYEIAVAGTDPTRADTDGDGILDGDEDSDGDDLSDADEARLGTDPLDPDSDGDRLADGLEHRLGLDPLSRDTDGDGVLDGDEDTDGDTLPNRLEVTLGTDAGRVDTDGDGLDDATELEAGTDATTPTDFSGLSIVLRSRTARLSAPLVVSELRLIDATIAPVGGSTPSVLTVIVEGRLSIDSTSRIDVSGAGYAGGLRAAAAGAPEGELPAVGGAGGSHGGVGGSALEGHEGDAGAPYGDPRAPRSPGGGGAALGDRPGGPGGGAILVEAGEVVLDGAILADGLGSADDPGLAGGGAGGSVHVRCERVTGTGRISARGGSSDPAALGGAGGGGRVVLSTRSIDGFDTSRVDAAGGRGGLGAAGGAGTILVRPLDTAVGALIVDNRGAPGVTDIAGPGVGIIGLVGDDFIVRADGVFADDIVGWRIDPDAEDDDGRSFEILAQDGDTIWTEPGLREVAAVGGRFRGVLPFVSVELRGGATLATDDALAVTGADRELRIDGASLRAGALHLPAATRLVVADGALDVVAVIADLDTVELTDGSVLVERGLEAGGVSLAGSTLSTTGPLSFGTLILAKGSSLTTPEPEDGPWPLELVVGGALWVDETSAIDVRGLGHAGGYARGREDARGAAPAGVVGARGAAGGSHGGVGGAPEGEGVALGAAHDDHRVPGLAGSGGSVDPFSHPSPGGVVAGSGGGAVRIVAGRVELEGVIDARGEGASSSGTAPFAAGGGAGGAVLIEAGRLEGAGRILADGGDAADEPPARLGGGGGGGRIALVVGDRSDFVGEVSVRGGFGITVEGALAHGGPGTLCIAADASDAGELVVEGGPDAPRGFRTVIGELGGDELVVGRLTIRSGARLESLAPLRLEALDEGAPTRWTLRGGLRAPRLSAPRVASLEVTDGEIDIGALDRADRIETWTLRRSRWIAGSATIARSVNLLDRSVLTVPAPTVDRVVALDLDVSGSFLIDGTSGVDLVGKGLPGARRGGNLLARGRTADGGAAVGGDLAGGAHGGQGGVVGATSSQEAYDDPREPSRPGAGGNGRSGSSIGGGNGGGLARLSAGTVVLNGWIDASGESLDAASAIAGGAGAGGGVWIDAGSWLGVGVVRARGGSTSTGAGAGGGGRVAIAYGDDLGFRGTLSAGGGAGVDAARSGAAGTVVIGARGALGTLRVDNEGVLANVAITPVRAVGSGIIAEVLPPDTVRASTAGFATGDTGLRGGHVLFGGRVGALAAILSNTGDSLRLEVAGGDLTAIVTAGESYRGAVVHDRVEVLRGAVLDAGGDLVIVESGELLVDEASELRGETLER